MPDQREPAMTPREIAVHIVSTFMRTYHDGLKAGRGSASSELKAMRRATEVGTSNILTAILADRASTRAAALEDAASWHDSKYEKLRPFFRTIRGDRDDIGDQAAWHRGAAAAIRALAAQPAPPRGTP